MWYDLSQPVADEMPYSEAFDESEVPSVRSIDDAREYLEPAFNIRCFPGWAAGAARPAPVEEERPCFDGPSPSSSI